MTLRLQELFYQSAKAMGKTEREALALLRKAATS